MQWRIGTRGCHLPAIDKAVSFCGEWSMCTNWDPHLNESAGMGKMFNVFPETEISKCKANCPFCWSMCFLFVDKVPLWPPKRLIATAAVVLE